MAPRSAGSASSEGASAKLRRSTRILTQKLGAEDKNAATSQNSQSASSSKAQGSASTSGKRKREGPQTKTTKSQARKKPATKRKTPAKTAPKKATPSSKQNQKYKQLRSKDDVPEVLPHNLGPVPGSLPAETGPASATNGSDKENQALTDENVQSAAAGFQATVDTAATTVDVQKTTDPAPKSERVKRPSYRLTPGKTPYPDLARPTPKECEEVNRLLSEAHGKVVAPATIPEPSLTVTGCGEVPSVLDALIRTLLSGATSGNNSALAFDGLVKRFGILKEGIGKGSVNWDAVRQAPLKDVFEAIKRGGLADTKSKSLKAILDKVYEDNQEQRNRLQSNDGSTGNRDPKMSPEKAEKEKEYEIACAEQHVLSLNHLHLLPTEEAMAELVKYPGIGPKTAACVILFCLQRPCFAVDTHIFRICKWLGWIPPHASEVTAFSHLDVRIPNHLKYSLHQLLIRHGRSCPRCRAITSDKSASWEEGCPIDDLVQRTGVRKGGIAVPPKRKRPARETRKRKRSARTAKKQTKTKPSHKKATPAKRNSTRKTRAQKTSNSPNATAPGDSSSSPPAAKEETPTHATPTSEKNDVSDSSKPEGNEQTTQATAAEENSTTRETTAELETTEASEDQDISSDDIKEESTDEEH